MHTATDFAMEKEQRRVLRTRTGRTVSIRPFAYNDADYDALVAIHNVVNREAPATADSFRHFDRNRAPDRRFRRYIVEQDATPVAIGTYGHSTWSYQPDKYFISVTVHPRHQSQGIGTVVYDFLAAELDRLNPRQLIAGTREDREIAVRFLEKRGFERVMRIPVSRLDTTTFDATRYTERIARTEASGIAIQTLSKLRESDPDWLVKIYDLEWECLQDVPTPAPLTRQPLEKYEKLVLGSPSFLPDAWFIAVDGDQYVGLSVLWKNLATNRLLETGLTGVLRSHRRRGIATALKVQAIQYAQAAGAEAIITDNEENNPMFQLNLQLGFVPLPASLDYEKRLGD